MTITLSNRTLSKEDIAFLRRVAKGDYFGSEMVFRLDNDGKASCHATLRVTSLDGCETTGTREIPVTFAAVVDHDKTHPRLDPSTSVHRAYWGLGTHQIALLAKVLREGDRLFLTFTRGAGPSKVAEAGFAVDEFQLNVRSLKGERDLAVIHDYNISTDPRYRRVRF